MSQEQADFAEFYEGSRDDCLRTVLATVRDVDKAQDLVAEAFARAWASWRKVSRHPAPRAWVVRTALISACHPGAGAAGNCRCRPRRARLRPGRQPGRPELTAVLQRLPARQRQVVALRIFLDLDTAQTAKCSASRPVRSPRT